MHSVSVFSHKKGEILPFAVPQRNQEDVTLSELSQAQEDEHSIVRTDVESETAILTEVETRRARPGTAGVEWLPWCYSQEE